MASYFLGVCSATGLISSPTAISLLEIQASLKARGHELAYAIYSGADVVTARNILAQLFLNSNADYFIGIDDDVGISAQAFLAMVDAGYDCQLAIVPLRQLDLAKFASRVRAGENSATAQRNAAPPRALPDGQEYGFFPVERGTTSFYIVARSVYECLRRSNSHRSRMSQTTDGRIDHWDFYDTGHDEDGNYLSTDYAFFRRVRNAGLRIHAYYGPGLSHSGQKTYHS